MSLPDFPIELLEVIYFLNAIKLDVINNTNSIKNKEESQKNQRKW